MDLRDQIYKLGQDAREAARKIAAADGAIKKQAILALADILEREKDGIFAANAKDLEAAKANKLTGPKLKRLEITPKVLDYMIKGCREVAAMDDPIGGIDSMTKRPNGMLVGKMRIPLGVVAMIFESRPNVTVDSAILALMAGNAVILRGGSEAFNSNTHLAGLIHKALESAGLPALAVQVLPTTDREAVGHMLKMEEYIDVVIPRGGEGLIRAVVEQAAMPVLKHYKGICHTYVDDSADLDNALDIIRNSKVQSPGVCNALECLLVHKDVAEEFLPRLKQTLDRDGVTYKACPKSLPLLGDSAEPATDQDWGYEFLDLILAVKVVEDMSEAEDHIAKYGSNHTEVILTRDYQKSLDFIRRVDASLVVANASTRFNDGGQLGLGAEIGISTSKLHSYGPMGIKELTSQKYILLGQGQVRD